MERARAWCVCMVMCCVCLMSASMAGKMTDLSTEILHRIAEYANWEDRFRLAQVNRAMRLANKAVDYLQYHPSAGLNIYNSPVYLINQFFRCVPSKLIPAMRNANLKGQSIEFYTQRWNRFFKGCSPNSIPDYSPEMTVGRVKQLTDSIKLFVRTAHLNWVCVVDNSDRKWAVNWHNEAKLDLSQFRNFQFISDSLIVGHSVTNDRIHVFQLLHIHPVNPEMLTSIHTLRIDPSITRDAQVAGAIFKVVLLKVGHNQDPSARIVIRTFIKNDKGTRVRFVIYDQFQPKPVSDHISSNLIPSNFVLSGIDTFTADGSEYIIGTHPPGQNSGFSIYRTSDATLLIYSFLSNSMYRRISSNQRNSRIAMWTERPNFEMFIYNRITDEYQGPVLPMARPFRFIGWFTDEIFGVECATHPSGDRFIAAVSVSNPSKEICFLPYKSYPLFCTGFPDSQTTLFSDGKTIWETHWHKRQFLMLPDSKRQRTQ